MIAIGYTNSSWTLEIGLLCEPFCGLPAHMDARGLDVALPEPSDPAMPTRPSSTSPPDTSSARSSSSPARGTGCRG